MPSLGEVRADSMTRLVDDFGYYLELWFDGLGRLHLQPEGTVTKAINFHSTTSGSHDLRIASMASTEQIWDDFANYIVVQGADYHGAPMQEMWADYDSKAALGRWIGSEPYQSDALVDRSLVTAALRWKVHRFGKPRVESEFTTGRDPTIEVGDRVTVDSVPVEVLEVRVKEVADEQMVVRVRFL